MQYKVTLKDVWDKEVGQRAAVRQCVAHDRELFLKFNENNPWAGFNMTDVFIEKLDKFIEKEDLKIIKEEPIPRVNESGRYVVDVRYTIEKPD